MAKGALLDAAVWLAEFEISGDLNRITAEQGMRTNDYTAINDVAEIMGEGLEFWRMAHSGLWEAGTDEIDEIIYDRLGTTDIPLSVAPDSRAEEAVCYFAQAMEAEYRKGDPVGDAKTFDVDLASDSRIIRGQIFALGQLSSGATEKPASTGIQLGAVSADQSVWVVAHVIDMGGTLPTLDVIVESDDADSFASATTRITIPQFTAVGSAFQSAAGAITDDYWRVTATVGGTSSPTATVMIAVGIK